MLVTLSKMQSDLSQKIRLSLATTMKRRKMVEIFVLFHVYRAQSISEVQILNVISYQLSLYVLLIAKLFSSPPKIDIY
jgi:hypothetical protein